MFCKIKQLKKALAESERKNAALCERAQQLEHELDEKSEEISRLNALQLLDGKRIAQITTAYETVSEKYERLTDRDERGRFKK